MNSFSHFDFVKNEGFRNNTNLNLLINILLINILRFFQHRLYYTIQIIHELATHKRSCPRAFSDGQLFCISCLSNYILRRAIDGEQRATKVFSYHTDGE